VRTVLGIGLVVVACAAILLGILFLAPDRAGKSLNQTPTPAARAVPPQAPDTVDSELTERLKTLSNGAGGTVGVAVTHVESGRTVVIQGTTKLPLYSVFKLPLAIAVLKEVEENRLQLDTKVHVTPADVLPGWRGNTDLWGRPVDRTVAELLELSLVLSDNTSSDKLLQLVGGPAVVTERMRTMGLLDIEIRSTVREFVANRDRPNLGSPSDFARLLTRLQKGEILQAPQRKLLLGWMEKSTTGLQRLRGELPAGTRVADKTGTGEDGSTTNDVGLITLPEGRGHLAMAVLVSGARLTAEEQEKLIARLARAAYDAYSSR